MSYDTASRRTQMTVAGQTAVNYGYDNADRLTGITQGSQSVTIGYDNADRRTTLTLPNGIKLTYGYDNANELTGLTYILGTSTVGTMTYGYDNDGRIINRGGTFDATKLATVLASASYDANNRLTNWDGQTLGYDANGNLTGDGTNTYTWNTRNQLTAISGGATASFLYDALGRRESKTISSTGTNFLYDGMNLEQELNGTTPTVNYLTGAGIDETLSRTDSSGTYSYLTDNLGSTLALTSSAGAISTSYTYDPYGNTTAIGTTSTNALQYTGRENDGDGLYYYRARYYSPVYGRFISEDPIGLAGGLDMYGYAGGDPIDFYDPYGLWKWGDPLPQGLVDFSAGFGDDLSFGLTSFIRNAAGISGGVNKCSSAYDAGKWSGAALGLAFGAATLGRHAIANGLGSIFSEGRTFGRVSRNWHGIWGSAEDLDHMFIPQSIGDVNAGWNLVPLSPWVNQQLLNSSSFIWGPVTRFAPYLARGLAQAGVAGLYGSIPTAAGISASQCGCNN